MLRHLLQSTGLPVRWKGSMSDDPAYFLDISGLADAPGGAEPGVGGETDARPWIGVQFECCGVYTRIYRNREGTAYEGCCPRCTRPVHIKVGPGGTSHRMFRAK
jgi:hypothetical protein